MEKPQISKFYSDILTGMKDYVRVIDPNGKVLYQNKPMTERMGDFVGRHCYELLKQDRRCEKCVCQSRLSGDLSATRNVQIDERTYSVVSAPVQDQKGSAVEVFHDVTELTDIRDQLQRQNRQHERDLEFAKALQHKLLPANRLYNDRVRCRSVYASADLLGGDIYDIFELEEGRVGFYIADVSGHGVTSSMITMFINRTLRNMGEEAQFPCKALAYLHEEYEQLNMFDQKYITILYGVYDPSDQVLRLANGGHNCPPVLQGPEGLNEVSVSGLPISELYGLVPCQVVEVGVKPGDRLFLYTDGIIEAKNHSGVQYGERFIKLLDKSKDKSSEEVNASIMSAVNRFTGNVISDDMAIVALDFL